MLAAVLLFFFLSNKLYSRLKNFLFNFNLIYLLVRAYYLNRKEYIYKKILVYYLKAQAQQKKLPSKLFF